MVLVYKNSSSSFNDKLVATANNHLLALSLEPQDLVSRLGHAQVVKEIVARISNVILLLLLLATEPVRAEFPRSTNIALESIQGSKKPTFTSFKGSMTMMHKPSLIALAT